MSTITTTGRWVRLPTALGADDRLRADQPGGAGALQILSSNATLAARENGLRTLWERGPCDVWTDLPNVPGFPARELLFTWNGSLSDGILAQFCGLHRVRPYGETADYPRLRLTARASAPSGETVGLILLVSGVHSDPVMEGGRYTTATTTSTTPTQLDLTLALTPELVGSLSVSPAQLDGTIPEAGDHPTIAAYVGAWCTSNSSMTKATIGAITLYLLEPS